MRGARAGYGNSKAPRAPATGIFQAALVRSVWPGRGETAHLGGDGGESLRQPQGYGPGGPVICSVASSRAAGTKESLFFEAGCAARRTARIPLPGTRSMPRFFCSTAALRRSGRGSIRRDGGAPREDRAARGHSPHRIRECFSRARGLHVGLAARGAGRIAPIPHAPFGYAVAGPDPVETRDSPMADFEEVDDDLGFEARMAASDLRGRGRRSTWFSGPGRGRCRTAA